MAEMFPRPTDYLQPQKSSAWLEKAKQLAERNEKKIEPFTFQGESCVKLNNIEAARRLLDNMYAQMEADKKMEVLEHSAPPLPEKVDRGDRFLFTVKVAIAEGLVPLESSPSAKLDTFVTLSDEQGNRLAKTRTIYESLSPRCKLQWCLARSLPLHPRNRGTDGSNCTGDESFDLSVEKPLWIMISVRDRALVGKHDTVGRAYLCLDPKRFGDFMTHDMWFDLDTQGRILLRVSMEGEKDDLQFYFGRAFRSLKRAENDMIRVFIDKVRVVSFDLFAADSARGQQANCCVAPPDDTVHPPKPLADGAQDAPQVQHGRKHRLQQGVRKRDRAVRLRARKQGRGADTAAAVGEAALQARGPDRCRDRTGHRAAI